MNSGTSSRPSPRSRPYRKHLVITAVIALVLWVGLTAAWNTRQMQLRMRCSLNLKKIGSAVSAYRGDHPQGVITLNGLVQQGYIDLADLRCPAAKGGISNYVLLSKPPGEANAAGEIWAYEPLTNHKRGANVLFPDGACRFVPQKLLHELNIPPWQRASVQPGG